MQQIHQLLAAARGHRLEALFILALSTGMRRGELIALKWQDLDLEKGGLTGTSYSYEDTEQAPGEGL